MVLWKRSLLTLTLCVLFTAFGGAQNANDSARRSLTDYVRTAIAFNKVLPQEKMYLHFDNTGYFKEETIYFKAYVVRSDKGTLSDISRVLYVELVTPIGDVIQTKKIKLENGQGAGCFHLKDILDDGFYEVRAYTRYMTNWDANGIFSRVFPIFDKPATEGDYSKRTIDVKTGRQALGDTRTGDSVKAKKINVRFFPEGGHAVRGLECRMAYEITDGSGMRLDDAVCCLMDGTGNRTVEDIRPVRDGRGTFLYIPEEGKYFLEVTAANGNKRKVELPTAETNGCATVVNAISGRNITAQFTFSSDLQNKKLGVVLCRNGVVMAFDTIRTEGDAPALVEYPREEIPNGVNEITVFDEEGRIYADRMFFIYAPEEEDSIAVTVKNDHLSPYKKIEMNAHTLPNTTFSLSVMDAETSTNGYGQNALTWLLLTSDLKGFIDNPNYYFEGDDRTHRQAADLLMMVQGWRRYRWSQLAGMEPFAKKQPIEDGLYIDGQLREVRKKHTVAQVDLKAFLYNQGGEHYNGSTVTDNDGYYAFHVPDCEGDYTLLMKTKKDEKDTKYYVGIDRNFSPTTRKYSYYESQMVPVETPRFYLNENHEEEEEEEDKNFVSMTDKNHTLSTVVVKRRRIFENARAGWETESHGKSKASIYYDCLQEADKIADRGERIPSFQTWITNRCAFLSGDATERGGGADYADIVAQEANAVSGAVGVGTSGGTTTTVTDGSTSGTVNYGDGIKITDMRGETVTGFQAYRDGLRFNNRPIIWILANRFKMITGCNRSSIEIYDELTQRTDEDMPMDLDDVKSVYISTNPNVWKSYVVSSDIGGMNPITIFIYPLRSMWKNVKGLRRTTFQGYNRVETFEMNDYDLMPHEADYRRTLYWNPNVTTDANGNADIEFWNNSGCSQILISAEGISADGKPLIY